MVFNVGRILALNISVYCVIHSDRKKTSSDRLVPCCSAYSIIKCCYCQQMRVNIALAKSTNIGYCLIIEMATDRVCLHYKINSWFALIHEK